MERTSDTGVSPRVLIFAPLGDDARALAEEVEAVGLPSHCLKDDEEFAAAIGQRIPGSALFAIISQEGATSSAGVALCELHASEPVWGRLPVLFLVSRAVRLPPACQVLKRCDAAPNFLTLERPVQRPILRQTLRAISESRRRQFQTRELMESLRKEKERSAFLLSELRHRVRNSLAVLQSLFKMTLRRADSLSELDKTFGGRLRNLSDAYMRLTGAHDKPRTLSEILQEHVGPYAASPDQLRLDGDTVELKEKAAFDLAMTIHELATNAAKYGGLSTQEGRVQISWSKDCPSGNLNITWRESGGPPVEKPNREGLGSTLIANFSSSDARRSSIEFEKGGVVWRAQISSGEFH